MRKLLRIICLIFLLFNILNFTSSSSSTRTAFCGFSLVGGKGGFYSSPQREYITKKAVTGDKSGLPEVVREIKKTLGFNVEIDIYIAKAENNCFATVGKGGARLLIADIDFLESVNNYAGTKWAAISVIAHEVGHHIAGFNHHESQLDDELDADYWSGYVLQKLGSSENAATKCILKFGTEQDTDSHPNKYTRAKTIESGWGDAKNGTIDYQRCENCKP